MFLSLLIALIIWVIGVAFVTVYKALEILALGIPTYAYNESGRLIRTGYKSIVEYIFTGGFSSNQIMKWLLIFIVIAIVMIGIFGVIKILIISFKGDDNNGDQTTPKIVAQRIVKGLALTIAVPVLILFLNFVMSNFNQLIHQAITNNEDVGVLVTKVIFGFTSNPDMYYASGKTLPANIFEVGQGVNLLNFRDALFYSSGQSLRVDIVSRFMGNPGDFFAFFGNFFGTEKNSFTQMFNCSWFLLMVVLLMMVMGCGKGLLACGKKIVDAVLLEVTFPFATSVYPIDNGKRTMAQIQAILTKLLGGIMLLFAFNLYLTLINVLGNAEIIDLSWVNDSGIRENPRTLVECMRYMIVVLFPTVIKQPEMYEAGLLGVTYVIIVCMGAVTVQTAPELLGHLISDQSASMSASDNNAVGQTAKSAIKTAGALSLGALATSYLATKASITGAGMGLGAGAVGVGMIGNGIGHKVQSYNAKTLARDVYGVTDKKLLRKVGHNAKHSTGFGNFFKGAGKVGLGFGASFVSKGGLGTKFGSGFTGIVGAGASMWNSHKKNKK